MKANYLGRMTSAEKKARVRETRRQIAECMDKLSILIESVVLWWEHETKGYGKVRLERDLESLKTALSELKTFYELEDTDEMNYACVQKLKALGVDISKLGGAIPIDYSIKDVDEPLPKR